MAVSRMDAAALAPHRPLAVRGPLRLLSDARLARLAGAGNESAFVVIYHRYADALYRYCRGVLGNGHDARDALQETMLAAYRAMPADREIALRPWLYRIAHNASITILRRRRNQESLELVDGGSVAGAEEVVSQRERL